MKTDNPRPGCIPFAIVKKELGTDGKPVIVAQGFACGGPRFEAPKKKARREFLKRTSAEEEG